MRGGGVAPSRRALLAGGAGAVLLSGCATRDAVPAVEPLAVGPGVFTFSGWGGPPLRVHYHRPASAGVRTPIAFILHGASRNADDYRDNWIAESNARGVIIAAPEFDSARFPQSLTYNLGGLAEAGERFRPNPNGAFTVLEPLFDELKARTGSRAPTYALFGHSAGGQFVHRFALFAGRTRASPMVSANSGWYTAANLGTPFPYGLAGTGLTERDLRTAFAKPLTVLLGTADTDRVDDNFRKTPEAEAQGSTRLERGQRFFAAAQAEALRLRTRFGWRLTYAPGVAHDNAAIASYAAALLFGPAEVRRP